MSTRFDTADRVISTTGENGSAWTYDGLGRMTQVPASAASTYAATTTAGGASGTVGLRYFVNDLTQTQVQDRSSKTTLALDAVGRFTSSTLATWDSGTGAWAGGVTATNHYDSSGGRPAWSETTAPGSAVTSRFVDGPSGDLTMTTGKDGGRTLLLTDLHGDMIAALPIADGATVANWTKLQFAASDEYGNPTPLATATNPNPLAINDWHVTAQKQQTRLGVTLMGARTYLPAMGIFTSPDPVPGGNTTTYAYPQNPIGQQDLDGTYCVLGKNKNGGHRGAGVARAAAKVAMAGPKANLRVGKAVLSFVTNTHANIAGYLAKVYTQKTGGRCWVKNSIDVCQGGWGHAYSRGGTTIGTTYVAAPDTKLSMGLLQHEFAHVQQWRQLGAAYPIAYFASGVNPCTNRFEIGANLKLGGYGKQC